jgi:hypothetical protein
MCVHYRMPVWCGETVESTSSLRAKCWKCNYQRESRRLRHTEVAMANHFLILSRHKYRYQPCAPFAYFWWSWASGIWLKCEDPTQSWTCLIMSRNPPGQNINCVVIVLLALDCTIRVYRHGNIAIAYSINTGSQQRSRWIVVPQHIGSDGHPRQSSILILGKTLSHRQL